ncbi:MAG: long-chain fatty acid--CoA ligase [Thermodesulfobacteria bacterium]|nr:long-chain fatty acid--CoA ligase [Thermodesulfobacteriota bacterium]
MELLEEARKKGLPLTIPQIVERSARLYPDRPALTARERDGDRTITYGQLLDEVQDIARGLIALGLKKGDRVAILGPNSPEWAKVYLATGLAGCINVPIDSLLSENEKQQLIAKADVKVAFVAKRYLEILEDLPKGFPAPKDVVCLDREPGPLSEGVKTLEDLKALAKGAGKSEFPEAEKDDVAAIIFTSGTTGVPKGVMLTHWNIVSDCIACSLAVDIGRENFLSVLPMHHTFECTAGFLLPLFCGCHITYARSLKSKYIMEDLRACKATVMLGVPLLFQKMKEGIERAIEKAPAHRKAMFKAMWKLVLAAERAGNPHLGKVLFRSLRKKAGLDTIRYFVSGGAALPPYVPLFFRRLGLDMIQGYGLTESSPVLTINPLNRPKNESVGPPMPGVEVKVAKPDKDGVGELAFRGPMIMKGYLNDPEATRQVIDDEGWLYTGDLGYVDSDGYVHICGRAKNLIVTSAGKNVYPEEIETLLNKSEIILESMVFGKQVESGGEEVCAVIVPDFDVIAQLKGQSALDEEGLHSLISKEVKKVNSMLASYKRIKSFYVINEELPKTSTKKIKRHLFNLNILEKKPAKR